MAFGREAEAEGFVNGIECLCEAAFKLNDCISRHNYVNWVNGDITVHCVVTSPSLLWLDCFPLMS